MVDVRKNNIIFKHELIKTRPQVQPSEPELPSVARRQVRVRP